MILRFRFSRLVYPFSVSASIVLYDFHFYPVSVR